MEYEDLEKRLRQEQRRLAFQHSKKRRRILWSLLALLLVVLGLVWAFWRGPWQGLFGKPSPQLGYREEALAGETARIQLIDVGQGLGLLVESGGEALLIDGGGGNASSKTVAVLQSRGIQRLKYVVITHYDEDHMGGAIGALRAIGAQQVLGPDYEEDSRSFRSLTAWLQEAGQEMIHPRPGEVFTLGHCQFTVLGPLGRQAIENDNSLVLRLSDGRNALLLTGDCEAAGEAALVAAWGRELKSDIYVVGHHGSYTSSTAAFLAKVKPRYLLLSCGVNNEYGHPHQAALGRLQQTGAAMWRTDRQGDIRLIWTKEDIFWETEPAGW